MKLVGKICVATNGCMWYIYSPSIIHSFIGESKEDFMDSTGYGCLGHFARSNVETPNLEMDDNEE